MKRKLFAILMTLTLVLTYMPMFAFAEDGAQADDQAAAQELQAEPAESGVEAALETAPETTPEAAPEEAAPENAVPQAAPETAPGAVTEDGEELNTYEAAEAGTSIPVSVSVPSSFKFAGTVGCRGADDTTEGASFTLKYADGSSKTYKVLAEPRWGYYLNGNPENGVYEPDSISFGVDVKDRLVEGDNEAEFFWNYWGGDKDVTLTCKVTVAATKNDYIDSISYKRNSSAELTGKVNYYDKKIDYLQDSNYDDNIYDDCKDLLGDTITINYKDEDEDGNPTVFSQTYKCEKYVDEEGDTCYSFIRRNEDGEIETAYPDFFDDQKEGEWTWKSGTTHEVIVSVDGVDAPQKLKVKAPSYKALTSARLELASGFEPKISIGMDFVDEAAFFGPGNKFIATYTDGSSETYVFTNNNKGYGFVKPGTSEHAYFYAGEFSPFKKGDKRTLTLTYYKEIDNNTQDQVEFKYDVTVNKYMVSGPVIEKVYTGKNITAKINTIKSSYGNKTLKSGTDFTYKAIKKKEVGYYPIDIKLKDQYFSYDYDDKPDTAQGILVIRPKNTTLKSVKAGKKSMTVKWKKLSKKDQKKIDGYAIEYSKKKDFSDVYKTVKVKKSAASKKISKLKKGTYYVRVFTYKKCKDTYTDANGKKHTESYLMYSKPSKVKKVKVK